MAVIGEFFLIAAFIAGMSSIFFHTSSAVGLWTEKRKAQFIEEYNVRLCAELIALARNLERAAGIFCKLFARHQFDIGKAFAKALQEHKKYCKRL